LKDVEEVVRQTGLYLLALPHDSMSFLGEPSYCPWIPHPIRPMLAGTASCWWHYIWPSSESLQTSNSTGSLRKLFLSKWSFLVSVTQRFYIIYEILLRFYFLIFLLWWLGFPSWEKAPGSGCTFVGAWPWGGRLTGVALASTAAQIFRAGTILQGPVVPQCILWSILWLRMGSHGAVGSGDLTPESADLIEDLALIKGTAYLGDFKWVICLDLICTCIYG
jgi:hypothetical protein